MQTIARLFLIAMLTFSLAAASGFAPRHAKASALAPGQNQTREIARHDIAHHYAAVHHHARDCNEAGKNSPGPAAADHNCCVTSCPIIAAFFELPDFRPGLPKMRFELPLIFGLTLTTQASVEPPPR